MKAFYFSFLKQFCSISILLFAAGIKEKLPAASVIWIGSFSNQWNNLKNWNCHCVPSNGDDISIQPMPMNYPVITAATAGTFIPRHITIQNIATLTITGGNLVLTGNWRNDGMFNPFPGTTVTFSGNTDQRIQGSVSTGFYNLAISTVSQSSMVILETNATVSNSLILTNGGLDLNGKVLSVTNPSVNAILRNAPSYIKSEKNASPYGSLMRTINDNTGIYVYPFGKSPAATDYIPFIFNVQVAGSASGTVSVSTYSTGPANDPYPDGVTGLKSGNTDNSANVTDRFWIIDVAGYQENPRAAITFSYLEAEVPANGEDLLVAQRWNGSGWDEPGSCVPGGCIHDAIANKVTASGVSNFSPWTLSRLASPLPVVFLNFEGRAEGNNIFLYWTTASELNNDYFTVEKSENSIQFESLAKIQGSGNSAFVKNYSYRDIIPDCGRDDKIFYYRIRQTDLDGKYSYSNTVPVRIRDKRSSFSIYPNPSDGKRIFFRTDLPERQQEVKVLDFSGREILSVTVPGEQSGNKLIDFKNKLTKGNYLIIITSGHNSYQQKLTVQ